MSQLFGKWCLLRRVKLSMITPFIICMYLHPVLAQNAIKPDTSKLRTQIRVIQNQINKTKEELKGARRTEENISTELDRNQSALHQTRMQLVSSKERLVRAETESDQILLQYKRCQVLFRQHEVKLAERVAANYRQGPVRYVSVLLGSQSMSQLSTRAQFVRSVIKHDTLLMQAVKDDQQRVLRWKAQVDEKAREIAERKLQLAVKQQDESKVVSRRRGLLAEAKSIRNALEQELRDLAEDSRTIKARIRASERTASGKARLLVKFSGSFAKPANGPITSGYGMRFHPILKRNRMHTGIDIGAPSGSSIVAAAAGIVTYNGSMSGYGRVIVIDHGGGTSTLYAHCSQLIATEGLSVRQGQLIARVGSTGRSTGPHLHFEVRRNGEPVNPQ